MHRHVDNVQGENNLKFHKFPLIEDRGGNVHIHSKEVCCSAYSDKLQHVIVDNKTRTLISGKMM